MQMVCQTNRLLILLVYMRKDGNWQLMSYLSARILPVP